VAQLTAAPMPISLAQLLGRDGGGGAHGGRASGCGKLQEMLGTLQPLDFAELRLLPQEKEKPRPFARDSRSSESSDVGPTPKPDADASSSAKSSNEARIEPIERCSGAAGGRLQERAVGGMSSLSISRNSRSWRPEVLEVLSCARSRPSSARGDRPLLLLGSQ
jgi:hypothetical protein